MSSMQRSSTACSCSRLIAIGFSWLYPWTPISCPAATHASNCSGNVSMECPGQKNVCVRPLRRNSSRMRGTPTSPANTPREMSSGESSPPYEPSQPPTASMSTPKATKISLVIAVALLPEPGRVSGGAAGMSDGEAVRQDALRIVGCEGESRGQQQACLPRAEVTGEDRAGPCQVGSAATGVEGHHRTRWDPRADEHRDARGDQLLGGLGDRRGDVSGAEGLEHQPGGAGGHRGVHEGTVHAQIAGHDVDPWQVGSQIERQGRRANRAAQWQDGRGGQSQHRASAGSPEGPAAKRLDLAHPAGGEDQPVEAQQGAQIPGCGGGGDPEGIGEV